MIRFENELGGSEYWYDSADLAKSLNIKNTETGRTIGRNLFIQFLRYNGVIMKTSNQPSQCWILLGLAKFHMVERRFKKYGMTIFSERAFGYIQNKIESGGFAIGFEKRIDRNVNIKEINEVC